MPKVPNYNIVQPEIPITNPKTKLVLDMLEKLKKSSLPHPFKCSRCSFVGKSRLDFNEHWSLEH